MIDDGWPGDSAEAKIAAGASFAFDDRDDGTTRRLLFTCPRTGKRCSVPLAPYKLPNGCSWIWDGNREAPTLTPSIVCGGCGWHGWMRDGKAVEA